MSNTVNISIARYGMTTTISVTDFGCLKCDAQYYDIVAINNTTMVATVPPHDIVKLLKSPKSFYELINKLLITDNSNYEFVHVRVNNNKLFFEDFNSYDDGPNKDTLSFADFMTKFFEIVLSGDVVKNIIYDVNTRRAQYQLQYTIWLCRIQIKKARKGLFLSL